MFPTGWIEPKDRTQEQQDAHDAALAAMPKFALGASDIPTGPLNIRLFAAWSHPDVVKDTGITFDRFHQLTGSCVGAGGGNALFTLIAAQRLLATDPTKAFVPWWPHPYGQSRAIAGFRGRGEGSLGSTFFQALKKYGVPDSAEATAQGVPGFKDEDGFTLTQKQEMDWSDGGSELVKSFNDEAMKRPLGSGVEVTDITGIRAALANGYPLTFACSRYIGSARVSDGVLLGYWDSNGGHQQSLHAVWDHPSKGPLYWAQNNWPASVYPRDPAGGPVCGCWVTEANVANALRYDSEVFALSHLEGGLAVQPDVQEKFSWYI
jgi:hypothetical protein